MSLYTNPTRKVQMGLCEVCDNPIESEVYMMHGNILMCSVHRDEELSLEPKIDSLIGLSQKIDGSIQIVPDIHNAKTVPIMELRAAIQQDESISEADKEYRFAQLIDHHILHLDKVIFETSAHLMNLQNERRAYQVNGQESVAKLREDRKAEFRNMDVNYQPVTPKKIKPAVTPSPGGKSRKKIDMSEIREIASKYGVDAATLQMMMTKKVFATYEDAAKAMSKVETKTN